jgi:hypothetical protein
MSRRAQMTARLARRLAAAKIHRDLAATQADVISWLW